VLSYNSLSLLQKFNVVVSVIWRNEVYKTIFNKSNDAIFIHPLQEEGFAKFIAVNEVAMQRYGYTEEEFMKLSALDITKQEAALHQSHLANRKKFLNKRSKVFETVHFTKDGKEIPVEISSNIIEIEGIPVIISLVRDITERKKYYNELQQANENIKATLTAIPDLMFETDVNGTIYDYHIPEHEDTYPEPKDFLGKCICDTLPESVFSIIINAIEEANIKGWHQGASYSLVKNNIKKWYNLSISVKKNSQENRFIILVRDISEQKEIEEILQQQNIEYQNLNRELTDTLTRLSLLNEELSEAKFKAEESDRLKTAFLENISHEVRTPMNGINGFIELLKLNSTLTDKEFKYISIIERSSLRLLKVINSIVEIAKLESGNIKIQNETIDIDVFFSELYQCYVEKAKQCRLTLNYELKLDVEKQTIQTDKYIIKRIFENLLDNAHKYTFKGEISFGCEALKDEILFYVSDTGEGIRNADLNKIFNQFVQGQLVSTLNSGAGLGLSIARAYIEELGGRIWVESELGKGSTFYFTVPAPKVFIKIEKTIL
jgi:PAS domain S-box-containing protein